MLKKLFGSVLLVALILSVAAPALAAPAAPVPTPQDLLTQLNAGDQARATARTLILEAQGLQAAADTAKSVYDAAQKAAADALLEAQKADTTARGSLPSFVVVVAQATGSATWAPIAQLLPGNGQVQAALNAARTAESAQSVANAKATEHQTAQTKATTALQKANDAMPVPPTDPAIATALAAQAKAEGEVVQLRKELTTEKARADRFETRVGELEKKLAAAPPVVAPAAPATTPTPAATPVVAQTPAAPAPTVVAPTPWNLAAEAMREKARADKAEALVAELRKQLAAAPAVTPAPAAAVAPAPAAATPAVAPATAPVAPVAPAVAATTAPAVAPSATTPAQATTATTTIAPAATPAAPAAPATTPATAPAAPSVSAEEFTTLRGQVDSLRAQLFWTWIAIGGLLALLTLLGLAIGVRRWMAARAERREEENRTADRVAAAAHAAASAAAGGPRTVT